MSRQLADLLLRDKLITQGQYADALSAVQQGSARSHLRHLISKGSVSEPKLLSYLSKKFGMPAVNIAKFEVSADVLRLVPADLAKKHRVIPIQSAKGTLVVALCDPSDVGVLEDIKFRTKQNVEAVLASFTAFDAAMEKYYGGAASVGVAIETYQRDSKKEDKSGDPVGIELVQVHDIDSASTANDAPVITLVNGILSEAIRRSASDIHIEPYEKRFRVRMRIDGSLHQVTEIPVEMKRAVIARVKIMSRMDIAESRIPQDGRIKLVAGGREIDFRVSSMPTLFGEKMVLRLLAKGNLQVDLSKVGFDPKQLETFKKGISAANGMVLVTGPTGSGKTTTLYSALSDLNQVTDNLSTVEDPVEYNLEGINQVQVQKEVGLTFASILRTFLRQDPDTILVGEIRDYETAEVAIQAALTGHLVLSTLHTNDAPSTITRLINMGVEPFLVVAALNVVVAQRLLRTICVKCKQETSVPKERLLQLGFSEGSLSHIRLFQGRGCANCNKTGYKGRMAIFEVMEFTPALKEMVLRGESAIQIKKQAIKDGMKTLRMSALTKMAEGHTTIEEALSMTMES